MIRTFRKFFEFEAAGGILLVAAAALAIAIANSPLAELYDYILHDVRFRLGFDGGHDSFDIEIRKSLLHWINDGLMVVFFFLVGLEIKRELVEGELSSFSKALLPGLAAVGGMAVPAAIYWFINRDAPVNMPGWAISSATDIAFSLGILNLLGSRAPLSLKIFLTAVAVLDDLGAIIVIAAFYSAGMVLIPLYFAAGAIACMVILNLKGVTKRTPYILLGIILWLAVLQSGVHATLAGVIAALFIPMRSQKDPDFSPLEDQIEKLHPWVSYGILPLFAFANAGVPFTGMTIGSLFEPLTFGIIAGLFIGKQLGIFCILFVAIRSGLSPMPLNTTWMQLYGMSLLCGIGFTMSLFIGTLAFTGLEQQASIRAGVLAGSFLSALAGYLILRLHKNN